MLTKIGKNEGKVNEEGNIGQIFVSQYYLILPKPGHSELIVYDALGRIVSTLVSETLNPGSYEATFDVDDLPSGIYFYKMTSNEFTQTKKMILIK